MSKNNYYLSPQALQKRKMEFQQNNPNLPKLENEILKLINYLRTNPEKYLSKFNNFFHNDYIAIIISELYKLEKKLHPFNTKKEITQAGKDYLDYLLKNNEVKPYINFNNEDSNFYDLKTRLSKYGERNGNIFESIIINSNSANDIVNKLVRDKKARKMILSPKMKYIGITCGFLPKWNSICTVIDIVQDFIAYKDINGFNDNNNIQIKNNNENKIKNKNSQKFYRINDNINSIYYSKTFKNKNNKLNNKNNFIEKNDEPSKDKETIITILERKNNFNFNPSRNNNKYVINDTNSTKSKLISPLATYKSDAYLIINHSNTNERKTVKSMKRINSDLNYNSIKDYQFNSNENIFKNFYNVSKDVKSNCRYNTTEKIRINEIDINNIDNINNNKDETKLDNDKKFNRIEVKLRNKKFKFRNEKLKRKEKLEILHSLNEVKNKIKEKEDKKLKKEEVKKNIEESNINNNNYNNTSRNDEIIKNNNINNKETIKTETTEINNVTKNNDNNKLNISFDNKYNSFFKENNQNNNINNENILTTLDQLNNTSSVTANQNKKQNSFFSHDTDINNILPQKESLKPQKRLKVNIKASNINNNIVKKEIINEIQQDKNNSKIDYKNISFKIDKTITSNNETIKKNELGNNINQNIDNSENFFNLKDKKEIKKLIKLYNKERFERKIKSNYIDLNNINNLDEKNSINNEVNNNDLNKKRTATFFYSNTEKNDEKIIKVYRKRKIDTSKSCKEMYKKKILYSNSSYKNYRTKKFIFPKDKFEQILDKIENKNRSKSNKNIVLKENKMINNNIDKELYINSTNRPKIFQNKSYEKILTENKSDSKILNNNVDEIIDENINKALDFQLKKFSNCNDNMETNVNTDVNDNITDYVDDIVKLNGYKYPKNEMKEININPIFNKSIGIVSRNYIYRKNKINSENKNTFNFYNKALNKNIKIRSQINDRYKNNTNDGKINHINVNKSKKKFIVPNLKERENRKNVLNNA